MNILLCYHNHIQAIYNTRVANCIYKQCYTRDWGLCAQNGMRKLVWRDRIITCMFGKFSLLIITIAGCLLSIYFIISLLHVDFFINIELYTIRIGRSIFLQHRDYLTISSSTLQPAIIWNTLETLAKFTRDLIGRSQESWPICMS